MITIHHLGVSQSERIIWLCEELGLPYDLVVYERDPVTRLAPDAYRALHPFGTAPVITDGTLTLGESGAIMEYILGRYGEGRLVAAPADADYADYLFWFHFANGSLLPAEMVGLIVTMRGGAKGDVATALLARSNRAYDMVEARLGDADYFAGSRFTAADIIMLFPLTTMRVFSPRDLAPYPNIRAYLQRIGTRPAYVRAMEKGDPGMAPLLT